MKKAFKIVLGWGTIFLCSRDILAADASINLAWNNSPDISIPGKVTAYKVYYGQQDFRTFATAKTSSSSTNVGVQTGVTLGNLSAGSTYYFGVVTVGSRGEESPFSNIISYTVPASTNPSQLNLTGMLPRLGLSWENGSSVLTVQGPLGATLEIQSSTNPGAADSWQTVTTIKLAARAPNANPYPTNILEKAFVPALETFGDVEPTDGVFRYYRLFMPLGFPIVAAQMLTERGYDCRLIAVRFTDSSPGIVCYVASDSVYIDFNNQTYISKLNPSGSTIREIATHVAASLGKTWTSASEFTVADDGTKNLFATVDRNDDPATDPPVGETRPSPDTPIDF
jgi:hypothetical protein